MFERLARRKGATLFDENRGTVKKSNTYILNPGIEPPGSRGKDQQRVRRFARFLDFCVLCGAN